MKEHSPTIFDRIGKRIRTPAVTFCRKSRILRFLIADDVPVSVAGGFFHRTFAAFRRFWMKQTEDSRILNGIRSYGERMREQSAQSYGKFGILCALFSVCVPWVVGREIPKLTSVLFAAALAVGAVPLLLSGESLGGELYRSVLSHSLFVGGLDVVRDRLVPEKKREPPAILLLTVSLGFGILCLWISPYLLALFRVLIVTVLLCFSHPEVGAVAYLAALPILCALPLSSVILFSSILLLLVTWLFKLFSGRRDASFDRMDRLVLLFALLFLLGERGNGEGVLSAAAVALFFPVRHLMGDEKQRRRAGCAIAVSGWVGALIGVAGYFYGEFSPLWEDAFRFSGISRRAIGTFGDPDVFAVFLLTAFPFCLERVLEREKTLPKSTIRWLGLSAVLVCTVVTWSPGGWLGLAAELLLFLLLYSERTLGTLPFLPLPALFAFPFLPETFRARAVFLARMPDSSVRYRLFLQILVELGVAGLTVFCVLLLCGIRRGVSSKRHGTLLPWIAVVGVLVMGLTGSVWFHKGLMSLFFAVLALASPVKDLFSEGIDEI